MKTPILALLALFTLGGHLFAAGQNYHVSPQGRDDGPGSASNPWRTLEHSVAALADGDTLTVHAGRYQVTAMLVVRSPNVTIKGAVGETMPLIDGGLIPQGVVFCVNKLDNVVLERLEVVNGKRHNIQNWGSRGFTVRDCHVHHAGDDVILILPGSTDWTISGCDIHDGGMTTLYNGQGLDCQGQSGHIVGNRVHDCVGGILLKGGASDCVVERNVLWNNTYKSWGAQFEVSLGGISGTWGKMPNDEAYEGCRLVARNNLILPSAKGYGIAFFETEDCAAYHNTIIQQPGARTPAIFVGGLLHSWDGALAPVKGSGPGGTPLPRSDGTVRTRKDSVRVTIRNNLVCSLSPLETTPLLSVEAFSETGLTLSHNLWYRGTRGLLFAFASGDYSDLATFQRAHPALEHFSQVANPGLAALRAAGALTNAPDLSAFMPPRDSPAVDGGIALEAVAADLAGVRRAQGKAPDLGALETGWTSQRPVPERLPPPSAVEKKTPAEVLLVRDHYFVTRQALDALGISYQLVPLLKLAQEDFARYRVIIWGCGATRGDGAVLRPKFDAFVRRGGTVIAFAEFDNRDLEENWLSEPGKREPPYISHPVTVLAEPQHPVLTTPHRLTLDDVKSMGGMNSSYYQLGSGWRAIVSGVSEKAVRDYEIAVGKVHHGLIEWRVGSGKVLLCALAPEASWQAVSFDRQAENVGRKLLENMLRYAGLAPAPPSKP